MATLIPALNSCKPRMLSGESRLDIRAAGRATILNLIPHSSQRSGLGAAGRLRFCARRASGPPASWLNRNGLSRLQQETGAVSIETIHSSKGLEFPDVAIPGIGYLPRKDYDVSEGVRLKYVGMTRAIEQLVMTCHRSSTFAVRLRGVMALNQGHA
jgi:hypothetical protein